MCSGLNVSGDVRWSIDLRYQSPFYNMGFYNIQDGVVFRTANDSNVEPDWDKFMSIDRKEVWQTKYFKEVGLCFECSRAYSYGGDICEAVFGAPRLFVIEILVRTSNNNSLTHFIAGPKDGRIRYESYWPLDRQVGDCSSERTHTCIHVTHQVITSHTMYLENISPSIYL